MIVFFVYLFFSSLETPTSHARYFDPAVALAQAIIRDLPQICARAISLIFVPTHFLGFFRLNGDPTNVWGPKFIRGLKGGGGHNFC